jgi:hypothetical protein
MNDTISINKKKKYIYIYYFHNEINSKKFTFIDFLIYLEVNLYY